MGGDAQATATRQRSATRELSITFLELVEYGEDRDQRSVYTNQDGHHFGPIRARAQHEKWVYVFRRHLNSDGSAARASDGSEWISLRAEFQYDEEGAVKFVNWKSKDWYGKDERPAETVPKNDPLRFSWNASRFELWICLSHVQLPRHRIETYLANEEGILQQRCWKVEEERVAALDPGQPHYFLMLDPVHLAMQLHHKYAAARHSLAAYEMQQGSMLYHASLFRSVALGYEKQEEEAAPGDVLDRIGPFISQYQTEREGRKESIDEFARLLYGQLMKSPVFVLAREDACDFADTLGELDDTQLDKVDQEVHRQAVLTDGASSSDLGLAYLKTYLAEGRDAQKNWYEKVALASAVTKRLASVSSALFKTLAEDAKVIASDSDEALKDLNAQRVRANGLLLEQLETVRLHVSGAQRTHVEELQVRILEPLHEAARPGRDLVLPGEPGFEEARSKMLSGQNPTELDARLRDGRLGRSQLRNMKAWQPLMPDPTSALQRTDLETLRLVSMDMPPTAGMPGSGPIQAAPFQQRYDFEVNDSGLIVARGRAGRVALADASSVLHPPSGGAGVPAFGQMRDGYVASLRRLVPAQGRTGEIDRLSQQVDAERRKMEQADVEMELRSRQLNYAGRLLMALDVLDVATGIPDLIDKLKAAERKVGRGESWWASYGAAVQSGVGLGSAVFGAISGTEQVLPAVQRSASTGLSRAVFGLKVLGGVGAVLGGIAAALTLHSEVDEHDTAGWVSAGLAVGSSVMILMAMIPALSWLGPVGIVLGIASFIVYLFADTKLEEQLRNCYWSSEETAEVRKLEGAQLHERLRNELQDLLLLLARPQMSIECWDANGEMSVYENTMREPPAFLRLTLRPGLHPPGTTYEIADLKLDHRTRSPEVVDGTFQIPDPEFDVVLAETLSVDGKKTTVPRSFMRQWEIGNTKLGGDMVRLMRMPPNVFSFDAVVHVRISEPNSSWNLDQSFKVRGPLGYRRYGRLFPSSITKIESVG